MILIPAIDLQAGRCVRLRQGQFDQVTQFDMSPIDRRILFCKTRGKTITYC
ncbi:HisA/HisF-related TIM barrel protein [Legionella longbeachae]|uniref:HisA/HisF-related TIM barrel protein n=1 Tax=Legionella longbeachae TaxID=450 RepID=UPI00155A316A|nr:HisA/HisF-related TIM barrel protein [Legionella longbeachae]